MFFLLASIGSFFDSMLAELKPIMFKFRVVDAVLRSSELMVEEESDDSNNLTFVAVK